MKVVIIIYKKESEWVDLGRKRTDLEKLAMCIGTFALIDLHNLKYLHIDIATLPAAIEDHSGSSVPLVNG